VEIGSAGPVRVFMDKLAFEADGIIPINRIKPHTDFHGTFESGLLKLCVIGLGKVRQAEEVHRYGVQGLREYIVPAARVVLAQKKVLFGIGLVENAYDETMIVRAVAPEDFEKEESLLLETARGNMPRLPADKIDILVADELGKNISGSGFDTNIIGRMAIKGQRDSLPDITNIIVTDLTAESHGNAIGMGLADFITRQLFDKVDLRTTYKNVITSTFLERGKIPIIAEDPRQAFDWAMRTCGPVEEKDAKIVRIKNTLHLGELYVSLPLFESIRYDAGIELIERNCSLFNGNDLTSF
ncbi:hypothetical protein LJC14_07900, partial [Treponema sp. OttesenSCG-928-L16]|nr:hypothetical protein [Treponema sp. OttesenSCG-928-L16]